MLVLLSTSTIAIMHRHRDAQVSIDHTGLGIEIQSGAYIRSLACQSDTLSLSQDLHPLMEAISLTSGSARKILCSNCLIFQHEAKTEMRWILSPRGHTAPPHIGNTFAVFPSRPTGLIRCRRTRLGPNGTLNPKLYIIQVVALNLRYTLQSNDRLPRSLSLG